MWVKYRNKHLFLTGTPFQVLSFFGGYGIIKIRFILNVKQVIYIFSNGFPEKDIQSKYRKVVSLICKETYNNVSVGYADGYNSQNEFYVLSNGERISFPYRVYFRDDDLIYSQLTDEEEKLIYNCIFSRSCDGKIREKHLVHILNSDFPEWCMPYILRLSSEYVVEIVEQIYLLIKERDNTAFQTFCVKNPSLLKRAYTRMTSYWNEFYREKHRSFDKYIGTRLFKECSCPNTNFEKL